MFCLLARERLYYKKRGGMRVIVFGGTGWVGHHIAQVFHNTGHKVTICSRGKKSTYQSEIPAAIRRVQSDKNNALDMANVFKNVYDVVIDSVPSDVSINNVTKYARGLKRYLHCSSTGGYAPLPFIPGDETMPYSDFRGGWKMKGIVDAKVMNLCCREGFPATVIRPSYITGSGMLPIDNMGGRRENFIRDILKGIPLDLPNDGQSLLQPVHVQDLAHAFLLAVKNPKSIGQIYNICLAKAATIKQYLKITAAALNCKVTINYMPVDDMLKKYGETINEIGLRFFATHMCFDINKAREQLGYVPHCSTEEAIEETARWATDVIS